MLDRISVRGHVTVDVEHDDGRTERIEGQNLVTTVGLQLIAQSIASQSPTLPGWIAIGTGTTAAAAGDTALGGEVDRNAIASYDASAGVATMKAFFSKSEANGSTIAEVGLFNAAASGTLVARYILSSTVAKDATKSLTITWTLTFTDN